MNRFQAEEISYLKLGGFLAYNVVALVCLKRFAGRFIKKNWLKRDEPRRMSAKDLTLINIFSKGTQYGVLLGGIYLTGFLAAGYYLLPLSTFRKYCELQEALNLNGFIFDPFYQEMLLYRKMRKFGLSSSLIEEVRADINSKKNLLIEGKKMKDSTIEEIKKAE